MQNVTENDPLERKAQDTNLGQVCSPSWAAYLSDQHRPLLVRHRGDIYKQYCTV